MLGRRGLEFLLNVIAKRSSAQNWLKSLSLAFIDWNLSSPLKQGWEVKFLW